MECKRDIEDLILFASKLSNQQQEKIFSYDNVKRLISQILRGNNEGLQFYQKADEDSNDAKDKMIFKGENAEYDTEFDTRRLKIAVMLAQVGLEICATHFDTTLEGNLDHRLHKYITEPLRNAWTICDTIINPHTKVGNTLDKITG